MEDKQEIIKKFLAGVIKDQKDELYMYLSSQHEEGEPYSKDVIDEVIHDVRLLESYL